MKEIIEILDRLRELSGNEQLDYLKSHADNVFYEKYYGMLIIQTLNIISAKPN